MKDCYIDKDLELFCYKESSGHPYLPIEFETFVFSGGEVHIKIKENPLVRSNQVRINCRIRNSNDLMRFALAVDALRGYGIKNVEAFIPYIPYARQDCRMVEGEPLSVRVFTNILNSLKLDKVIYYDAHSVATLALIDNSEHHSNFGEVNKFINHHIAVYNDISNIVMVSPDGGAYKKIFKMCEHIKFKGQIVNGTKVRDLNTGHIIATDVTGDISGKDCLVVDDICDGGKTFVELAKALKSKGAEKLYLFVSHGIFSKGLDELLNYYSLIGTTNSFRGDYSEAVKVIKLEF